MPIYTTHIFNIISFHSIQVMDSFLDFCETGMTSLQLSWKEIMLRVRLRIDHSGLLCSAGLNQTQRFTIKCGFVASDVSFWSSCPHFSCISNIYQYIKKLTYLQTRKLQAVFFLHGGCLTLAQMWWKLCGDGFLLFKEAMFLIKFHVEDAWRCFLPVWDSFSATIWVWFTVKWSSLFVLLLLISLKCNLYFNQCCFWRQKWELNSFYTILPQVHTNNTNCNTHTRYRLCSCFKLKAHKQNI